MQHTTKPPLAMSPDTAAIMALAMPLVQAFAAEIARLPAEEQNRRIAKVLAAMREDDAPRYEAKAH